MLEAVAGILQRRGVNGWLVGGSVRDRELGRYSPDVDLVVADDARAVARALAASLKAPWFALSERHSSWRVIGAHGHVDVTAMRGGSILADLALRDFTINAMAVPVAALASGSADGPSHLKDGHGAGLCEAPREAGLDWEVRGREPVIVDPFDGLAHLRQRRLVAVSDRIFADDPVRLMRAARFCHMLGLRLDESLARLVREQAPRLVNAAAERVAAEMILTLGEGRSAEAARLWRDLGLLAVALPEIAVGGEGSRLPDLLERVDDLLARPAVWFPEAADALTARLQAPVDGLVGRPVALRLCAFTEGLTAAGAETVAHRLKLSGEMGSLLRTVSKAAAGSGGLPAISARREAVSFLWDAAPWEPETIALAAVSAAPQPDAAELGPARAMMSLWADRMARGVPEPPVGGDSIMRELGLKPGPQVGKALRAVRLAWESGEIGTAEEALRVARQSVGAG